MTCPHVGKRVRVPDFWSPPESGLWTPPQHLWIPERDGTSGREAIELAASVGWIADTEQELMVDAMLSERDGKWAAFETTIIEPRQNGKTDSGQVASLYDLFVRKVSRIVWTAHKYKTCADSFAWFAGVCENYDHLRKRVYKVTAGVGEQSIKLLPRFTGPQMDFLARSSGGGRGLDGDVTNLDEALYLSPTMMGALVPIMSAKPNPQLRYFSSPGLLASEVLRGLRDRGRAGGDPSLIYAEWGCPPRACADPECSHLNGSAGCLLDDLDYLRIGNPAAGGRITENYLRGERRTFGISLAMVAEHLRERTGWWQDPPQASSEGKLFPAWDLRAVPAGEPVTGLLAIGADTSWDGSTSWLAAAHRTGSGVVQVEMVATGHGTGWVRPWLFDEDPDLGANRLARLAPVAIGMQQSGAPVSPLLDELRMTAAESVCRGLTGADMAKASARLFGLIDSGGIEVVAHPKLDRAAAGAIPRPMADAWVVDRKASPVDVSPLIAVIAAVWGLLTTAEDKPDEDYDVLDSIG
jgi:hypothetical protein